MTIREAYLNVLTELVKEESPTLYLEDFLYYFNKAVGEFMNLRYEKFELTQQLTDDLRPWKCTYRADSLEIDVRDIGDSSEICGDYRHVLSCTIGVTLVRPVIGCDQRVNKVTKYKVTRASAARAAGILDNDYFRAAFYRPYFSLSGNTLSIDVGEINEKWVSVGDIQVEYLMQPVKHIMTDEDITLEEDESEVLNYPLDVAEAIVKRALLLILERDGNPRMQTNMGVNQSINDITLGGGK